MEWGGLAREHEVGVVGEPVREGPGPALGQPQARLQAGSPGVEAPTLSGHHILLAKTERTAEMAHSRT